MKRLLFIVILMFFLCPVKRFRRENRCHDRFCKFSAFLKLLFGLFSNLPLIVIMVENSRLIRLPAIIKLSAGISWVDLLPECIDKFFIWHYVRVECNLYRLNMTGCIRANLFICRVLDVSAGITRKNTFNTRTLIEWLKHAPEAPARKRCEIRRHERPPYL